ncbi:two-component system regulatory protein YycI [Aeribacillus composti]|uniref:two-component system regulatory protein YycI n=1 Tax=Aeribacillus composti TaxID=1868734 RepID=UPI002E1BF8AC|nr:two-component system regulatory protein YycI [Aeribacillus composti]
MDWSKTKTLFIIAFLILDIYLAFQYVEKIKSSKYDMITKTTIEEQFAAENIQFGKLPKEVIEGSYITAENKIFKEEEIEQLKNQKPMLPDEELTRSVTKLRMSFDKPIPIVGENIENKIKQILTTQIIAGSQYKFWRYSKETREIICLQEYKGKIIFQDVSDGIGMIVFYLNDKNEIVSYQQTLLEDIKELEKQEILPAIKALEALYEKNDLKSNSKVTDVEYGYYTQYPLSEQQILAPTWHVVVNKTEDYYVNALEGQVIKPEKENNNLE